MLGNRDGRSCPPLNLTKVFVNSEVGLDFASEVIGELAIRLAYMVALGDSVYSRLSGLPELSDARAGV